VTDKPNLAFNPEAMLGNLSHVKGMIKRIRQKDGGVGSLEDELSLHRTINDIELLADMVAGLKLSLSEMQRQASEVLATRDARINELENPPEETPRPF
tara:strand:- start:2389 stop:2682 length:294 start_codon:yes stop_codon:yes gene_type:complete